jgi:hypothetical protein
MIPRSTSAPRVYDPLPYRVASHGLKELINLAEYFKPCISIGKTRNIGRISPHPHPRRQSHPSFAFNLFS